MGCKCCKAQTEDEERLSEERMPEQEAARVLEKFHKSTSLNSASFMKIWRAYDKDCNGYIEAKELDTLLTDIIKQESKEKNPKKLQELKLHLLHMYDTTGDRRLEMNEVARLIPVEKNFLFKFPKNQTLSRQDYDEIFDHYDVDRSGYIDMDEMLAVVKDLFQRDGGQVPSATDLESYTEAICEIYDVDKNGRISREELGLLLAKSA